MDRRGRTLLLLVAAAGWLLVTAAPALAACHIAGFVEEDPSVAAAAGSIEVVVELRGRVASCAGTVDVVSVDGAATAGEDYEAVSQTLTFEEGDDRVESVVVTIVDDDEGTTEDFTLELRNPTGGITGTGDPITITITADAESTDDAASDDAASDGVEDSSPEDEGSGGELGIILGVVGAVLIGGAALVLLRRRA